MSRKITIAILLLAAIVIAGVLYVRALHNNVAKLQQTRATEEQERREVVAPPVKTSTDVKSAAQIFWISAADESELAPVTVQLPLSADPAQRAKQILTALIANPPSPEQRTIPATVTVLGFYILPNDDAIADFSDTLATETPSGILSEWLAVESIGRTLGANFPQISRVKILIHGQEMETLAGHIALSGFFDVRPQS